MCRWRTVLLVIPHLGGGGAERVTELLARHLSQERFEIHLGLVTQASIQSAAWPENVVVHALGARRVRDAALRLVVLIRRLRPFVVFSESRTSIFLCSCCVHFSHVEHRSWFVKMDLCHRPSAVQVPVEFCAGCTVFCIEARTGSSAKPKLWLKSFQNSQGFRSRLSRSCRIRSISTRSGRAYMMVRTNGTAQGRICLPSAACRGKRDSTCS